jgi:hypothetical protein
MEYNNNHFIIVSRAYSLQTRGVSPIGGAARGWAAPPHGEAGPWLGSVSSLVFWKLPLISGRSAFVSSNSENISCVTFLKHKNSRKQGTGTMASC